MKKSSRTKTSVIQNTQRLLKQHMKISVCSKKQVTLHQYISGKKQITWQTLNGKSKITKYISGKKFLYNNF
jgi:hypothetical protein